VQNTEGRRRSGRERPYAEERELPSRQIGLEKRSERDVRGCLQISTIHLYQKEGRRRGWIVSNKMNGVEERSRYGYDLFEE